MKKPMSLPISHLSEDLKRELKAQPHQAGEALASMVIRRSQKRIEGSP
jgi:hypothetical protein